MSTTTLNTISLLIANAGLVNMTSSIQFAEELVQFFPSSLMRIH